MQEKDFSVAGTFITIVIYSPSYNIDGASPNFQHSVRDTNLEARATGMLSETSLEYAPDSPGSI
jgi:hypothetical protein